MLIPAALHGRHRRPAVPRVRRHPERDHSALGAHFPDADTDDVRPFAAAHAIQAKHGRFYEWSENVFNKTIAFYGRTVQFVLKHQTITLLVTVATLVGTIWLYIIVPKGFFPVQDTGVIIGISDARESISFAAMAQRQQALAAAMSERPGRGEPVFLHRRRRNQHYAEQRTHPDQPETARRARR